MTKGTAKRIKQKSTSATELLRLHHWNRRLAVVYLLEGVAYFLFSAPFSAPVIANYLAIDPINSSVTGHTVLSAATRPLFNISIPGLVTVYFLVSAFAHTLLVTVYRKRYEVELSQGVNMIRWLEYMISASLMLITIGLLSGVYDLATLIAIFAFIAIMCLLGFVTELTSRGTIPNQLAYLGVTAAGFMPWLIVALYVFNASYYGAAHISTFVYWIYGTMFVCTAGFALNMYLRYRNIGRWTSYMYTERGFMLLSFIVKTLLAWQVFVGILRP